MCDRARNSNGDTFLVHAQFRLRNYCPRKWYAIASFAPTEPLFVISSDRTMAGLAAGMLRGAGCMRPVVVDGGMQMWDAQGLPEAHSWRLPL